MDIFIKIWGWGVIEFIFVSLENMEEEVLFNLWMYFGGNNEFRFVKLNSFFCFEF